jgi:YbbR domain-containing protein
MNTVVRTVTFLKNLFNTWRDPIKIRRFLKGFSQHWGIRISAFLLAVGAWAYVKQTVTKINREITVPLNFITAENFMARAFTMDGVPLSAIEMDVSCSRGNETTLNDSNYIVDITLTGETAGNIIPKYTITVKDNIRYIGNRPDLNAKDYVINELDPREIRIEVDETRRKFIPVMPVLEGSPKPGFEVVDTEVIPSAVMVEGPARIVDVLTNIPTEKINIEGMNRTLESDYKVRPVDPNVTIKESLVTVEVRINTKPVRKVFTGVKVKQYGSPERDMEVSFAPQTVDVTLEAQKDIIDLVTSLDIRALVDVDNYPVGEQILPVHVIVPPNCTWVATEPGSVTNYIGTSTKE